MIDHSPAAEWGRFAQGKLASLEKLHLLTHLLRGCPDCATFLAPLGDADVPGEDGIEEYTTVVKRAIAAASRPDWPRQQAIATLASLLKHGSAPAEPVSPSSMELAVLEGLPRFKALIQAVGALRREDPQSMLRFAKLACYAAERLRMREFGRQPVADLRALAWTELGNAYRVCNELRLADNAMNRAVYWCQRGSRSDLLLARIAHFLALLLSYQRRFPEGLQLLALVYQLHLSAGNSHLAAEALITRANLTTWGGDHRRALSLLRRALELLEPNRDPRLEALTLWNMIELLADLGRFRTARRLLWQSRLLFTGIIEAHRMRWLEAKILAGLGDFPRAEAAFQQARAGFVEHEQPYPAALVGLDLAALWARQGKVRQVFELAEEMIVTFRALRIAREAVAALLVLKRACQFGGEVLDLIDIAGDLLRHLERQPVRPRAQ